MKPVEALASTNDELTNHLKQCSMPVRRSAKALDEQLAKFKVVSIEFTPLSPKWVRALRRLATSPPPPGLSVGKHLLEGRVSFLSVP